MGQGRVSVEGGWVSLGACCLQSRRGSARQSLGVYARYCMNRELSKAPCARVTEEIKEVPHQGSAWGLWLQQLRKTS